MTPLHQPVRTLLDDGIATVGFAFPGAPANAFTLPRLAEVVGACEAAAARPDVEVIVVRSDSPLGFSAGHAAEAPSHLRAAADRAQFTSAGQRLLTRLAELPVVTLAYIEGECRGPGFEVALACDYRLAVAGPDSWVGFGPHALPAWGGSARLRRPLSGVVTAREAVQRGVFDDAFCARRGRIELRQWLDRLQRRPVKPWRRGGWFGPTLGERLAAERRAFVSGPPVEVEPVPLVQPLPAVVAAWGVSARSAAAVVEVVVRGGRAVVVPRGGDVTLIDEAFAEGRRRGRWTPLEESQARGRLTVDEDADTDTDGVGWVIPVVAGLVGDHRPAGGRYNPRLVPPVGADPAARVLDAGRCPPPPSCRRLRSACLW